MHSSFAATTTGLATPTTHNPYKRSRSTLEAQPLHRVSDNLRQSSQRQQQQQPKQCWTLSGQSVETSSAYNAPRETCRRFMPKTTALDLLRVSQESTRSDPLFMIEPRPSQHPAIIHPTKTTQHEVADDSLSLPSSSPFPPSLDWLHLHAGTIHELSGPAGTGKTQIALTLCLQAAAASAAVPDKPSSSLRSTVASTNTVPIRAVYLALGSTRLNHVLGRLNAMSQQNEHGGRQQQQQQHQQPPPILQRIVTKCCVSIEDLLPLVSQTLPQLLKQEPHIRVIVLDSIANVIRHDDMTTRNSNSTAAQRAALLFQLTAALQSLFATSPGRGGDNHSRERSTPLSIVVLNQVTADVATLGALSSSSWKPALGLSWEHCIHSRFQLSRRERSKHAANGNGINNANDRDNGNGGNDTNAAVVFERSIRLVHSNRYPTSSASFAIDSIGCYLVEDKRNNACTTIRN